MNQETLRKCLDLQKKAYALLLWLDGCATAQPQLLDEQHVATYRSNTDCGQWLAARWSTLPQDCRPAREDLHRFANLFAAFFQTSFQVADAGLGWDKHAGDWAVPLRRRLISRANLPGSGKPRKFRRLHRAHEAETVRNLQLLALEGLAFDLGLPLVREEIVRVQGRDDLQDALNIWSYAWELVRRAKFSSQGPAVHQMWLAISPEERARLDAQMVWRARERLMSALKREVEHAM